MKTLNTGQTGRQILWGPEAYSLGPYNPATGLVLVLSPRQKTPYRVYLLPHPEGKQCNCRGFQTWHKCRHTNLSHPVGAWIWESCFLSMGEESAANAGQSSVETYADFMGLDNTLTDGEAEAIHRQEFEGLPVCWSVADRGVYNVLFGEGVRYANV